MKYRLVISAILLVFANSGMAQADSVVEQQNSFQQKIAALESAVDGRIGVYAVDTANGNTVEYRGQERFPMGCTSKVIGVAAVLKQSEKKGDLLQQKVTYTEKDLQGWAPITKQHVNDGMTIKELSAAAISYSDNTAMNLLIGKLGGLDKINNFARSLGDKDFQLSHDYPREAETYPDKIDDTTTPMAMEKSLQTLALGNVLAPMQRELLVNWLKADVLGYARIRAGVPKNWVVGDKTGTGFNYGTANDVAVIWPPKCAPIILTVYFTGNKANAVKREDAVASATRLAINELARTDECIKQQL